MSMRSLLTIAAVALALAGCTPKGGGSGASSSGGGGGGLIHDIASEIGGSKEATRKGVAFDLYYDVSDSSTALRKPLGKLLETVADTYPEAVPYSYSFYGQNCDLQGDGMTNVQSLRRADKAWAASQKRDKGSNLAKVFERIKQRAEDEPKTQFAALVVSDGGFEDTDPARGALRALKDVPNLRALVFVGVHTGDNPKLQRLTDLTRVMRGNGDPDGVAVQLVTDANNESKIADARKILSELVQSGKKVD